MVKNPQAHTNIPFIGEKKTLMIYSFHLALGSVALFIFLTGVYTTLQAVLWKYTAKYIVNSSVLTLVAFTAGILFIASCYLILKKSKSAKPIGYLGYSLLIVYPFLVLFLNIAMPYSFTYLTILGLTAIILLLISLSISRK